MKRVLRTIKNLIILAGMVIGVVILLHDFIFLTIIPFFSHDFYCITYFGLLVDLVSYAAIKMGALYFEILFQ